MAYTPREIKDRVAVGDDIFIVQDLGNNRIRLIPAPTHVSEPGTPVNKALLQPIENELGDLSTDVANLSTDVANLSTTKVDKVPGKSLSTNDFTDTQLDRVNHMWSNWQLEKVKTGTLTLKRGNSRVQASIDAPRGTHLTCLYNASDYVSYSFSDHPTYGFRVGFYTRDGEDANSDIEINYTICRLAEKEG